MNIWRKAAACHKSGYLKKKKKIGNSVISHNVLLQIFCRSFLLSLVFCFSLLPCVVFPNLCIYYQPLHALAQSPLILLNNLSIGKPLGLN